MKLILIRQLRKPLLLRQWCDTAVKTSAQTEKEKKSNKDESSEPTPDKAFMQDVLFDKYSEKPFYHIPEPKKIDYNVIYTKNTSISASRAISDYLLTIEDLSSIRKTKVRTAYSGSEQPPDHCYLKLDVEKRAVERWGSMDALQQELLRRKLAMEEGERYRKGLSALIGHLKKTVKDQTKKKDDKQLFGSSAERKSLIKGSGRVVLYAIASNVLVTSIKFGAYIYTGSASMLSEAIHSLADAANQVLLYIGILHSIKQPAPDHPYGWVRSRYIYSLISGCGIFFLGAGFSVYHGMSHLFTPTHLESINVAYTVAALSFVIESSTMMVAFKQVMKSAKETGVSFREYVSRGRDPNAVAVLLEDSAAVLGVLIASGCIGMTAYTGNPVYDAIGSITIGGLLGVIAVFLIQRNADFLIGRSIPPDRLREIITVLENDLMVRSIHDVKATEMGADTVRFKAELNFDGREITKVHLNQLDLNLVLQSLKKINTPEEVELFLMEHGEQIIDVLGSQVDRIERNIKQSHPEVRHVDLEIL